MVIINLSYLLVLQCHKADVTIPVSDSDFITIAVPFTDFSNNWRLAL